MADEFLGGSETALFGVFDGHGIDGRKVSNGIAARLPKLLADCTDFKACQRFRHVRGSRHPACAHQTGDMILLRSVTLHAYRVQANL